MKTKIRVFTEANKSKYLGKHESIDTSIKYKYIFLNDICGVVLNPRGVNDPHVMMTFIKEDDGFWYIGDHGFSSYSSYWIFHHIDLLNYVVKWLNEHCEKNTCGWKFKQ